MNIQNGLVLKLKHHSLDLDLKIWLLGPVSVEAAGNYYAC